MCILFILNIQIFSFWVPWRVSSGLLKEMLIHCPGWHREKVKCFISKISFFKFLKYPFLTFILSQWSCLSKWRWNMAHSADKTLLIFCAVWAKLGRETMTRMVCTMLLHISVNLSHSDFLYNQLFINTHAHWVWVCGMHFLYCSPKQLLQVYSCHVPYFYLVIRRGACLTFSAALFHHRVNDSRLQPLAFYTASHACLVKDFFFCYFPSACILFLYKLLICKVKHIKKALYWVW